MDLGPNVTHTTIGKVSVQEVGARLADTTESHWQRFEARQRKGSIHQDTRSLVIRFLDDAEDETYYQDDELWEYFRPFLSSALDIIRHHYGYQTILVSRILFVELKPNGQIDRHVDRGNILGSHHRIHIPINTTPACIFKVMGKQIPLEAGTIVEINNWRQHEVRNGSDVGRVHLICDVISRDELWQDNGE
jgi:hypothetical protein